MMKRLNRTNRSTPRGFSITELLVAISIIGLLLAIVFPVIGVMTSSSRVEAGLNIVGMSSDVARQWVQAEAWAQDASPDPTNEEYSGTAALFCPTGEVRIVANDRKANNGSDYLEDLPNEQNGYKDLSQVDYIQIPNGVGVAGIYKDPNDGGAVKFIAPPFAIAYNEDGQLNYGDASGKIYYDGYSPNVSTPIDGFYEVTRSRPTDYDPFEWRGFDNADNNEPLPGSLKKALPFEAIECVPGVVVYSADEFDKAGFDFSGGGAVQDDTTDDNDAWDWLQENGRTVFFSPHTGIMLRDEKQD